ncbi:unnamed protein product [Penicillium salamii]|uniref:Nephrocystin 3-like N-terminal domain-containing protein n=1 Tax=Penicillium salamii TaxID=1612424 RepID=A0A9W4JLU8_9EURO|nr:unnamed protein product [Penicillium salamii]
MTGVLGSLSFPEMLDRRDNIAPCHTDTCRWILELDDFKNWKIQSRGLLWIKGKPGAGKSTLMAFLYSQLSESQELQEPPIRDGSIRLDFFFSARGTELQHTPLGMLRSLLNQLYDFDETVRPPVRKIFEDRCRQYGYGENHWQWTQVKLEELLADAILESAKQHQVMVFIDALDEAGAEFAQHVVSYFHRLASRAEKIDGALKICISCRHYPIAEDVQAVNIIVEAHNRDDIASYIENAFVGIAAGENQEDLKDLTKHLIRQADGLFQWIHLLVPSIKRRIAERESFDEIYSWLREVPAGLEEVYVYIINYVIVEHNRRQSFLLFQWVCLAEEPLTVTEMRYALATDDVQISLPQTSGSQISTSPESLESTRHFIDNDDRMKTRVKALSGGLAEVVLSERNRETVQVVQVVHQSVNDFLYKKGFELLSSHITATTLSLDGGTIVLKCQATLYRSCLICVAIYAQLFETMNDPLREPGDIGKDVAAQCNAFSRYATVHLFRHANKSARSRLGILKNEVDLLLSIMEAWVPLLMCFNGYSLPYPAIQEGAVLLHVAAYYDLVDIIESLLDRSEDIETRDYSGNTALHLAAQEGHMTASKILCERGASCEAKNDNGKTALIRAASHGNLELFEWLLHKGTFSGIDDNKDDALRGGRYGNALQAAAHGGHVEVVRMLLDTYIDVNIKGGIYGNALQAAADGGHVEVMRLLLDAHADVNAQGGQYGNALQAAAHEGHCEVVRMLLDANADVNAQGGKYGNALQAATVKGRTDIVTILIDADADVNAQGGKYGNALQAATVEGRIGIMRILVRDSRASVNAKGGKYQAAILAALSAGCSDDIHLPPDAGAYLPLLDELGQNLLHIAVSRCSPLSRPKDITFQFPSLTFPFLAFALQNRDKLLRNPLHAAIYRGVTPSFAIKLLHLGADPSILDGYGRNIVDWIQGNRYWIGRIHPHCSQTLPTPHETQYLTVCQSVLLFANTIFYSLPNLQWPLVQQLGHFLLSLDDEDRATNLFQLHLFPDTEVFRIECFQCEDWIGGRIFVCRKCPNVVLCSYCVGWTGTLQLHRLEHEKFEISALRDKEQFSRSNSEELGLFLQDLMEEYSAKSADDPKKGFLDYPSPSAAQEETGFSLSKTTFGPAIIACTILVVIFGVLIGCLYF